jgi:hypothetical protein
MTKNEWAAEIAAALGAAGDWRVFKAWVELNSPMIYADVASATLRKSKRITLARDRFSTAEDRRTEILRQLGSDTTPEPSNTGRRKGGAYDSLEP